MKLNVEKWFQTRTRQTNVIWEDPDSALSMFVDLVENQGVSLGDSYAEVQSEEKYIMPRTECTYKLAASIADDIRTNKIGYVSEFDNMEQAIQTLTQQVDGAQVLMLINTVIEAVASQVEIKSDKPE